MGFLGGVSTSSSKRGLFGGTVKSDCGANAPGGGGFQHGNSCGGSGSSSGNRTNADIKQTDTPEFKSWFGDSKVVDDDGEPKVVYHGSPEVFQRFITDIDLGEDRDKAAFFSSEPKIAEGYSYHMMLEDKRNLHSINQVHEERQSLIYDIEDIVGTKAPSERNIYRWMNENSDQLSESQVSRFDELSDKIWDYDNSETDEIEKNPNIKPVYLSLKNPKVFDADGASWDYIVPHALATVDRSRHDGIIWNNLMDGANEWDQSPQTTYAVFNPSGIKSSIGNDGSFDPSNADITKSIKRGFLGGVRKGGTDCGANAIGGGGFQSGNTCGGKGNSIGPSKVHKAANMPDDMDGDVEILDSDTGSVLSKLTASEARSAFAEELQENGTLDGLSVRKVTDETEAEAKKKDSAFWDKRDAIKKEAERQEKLDTGRGVLPGHEDYVDPPSKLYHATFNADDIVSDGFKSSDELGKQTLGGTASDTVSFTTKENAEKYRDGLEYARLAAQGKLSDGDMIDAATKFGVTRAKAGDLLRESQRAGEPSHEFFQKVSFEGREFPLFMGGSWPTHLASAKPASIVSVDSSNAGKLLYNKGETEWRATDYKGIDAKKAD